MAFVRTPNKIYISSILVLCLITFWGCGENNEQIVYRTAKKLVNGAISTSDEHVACYWKQRVFGINLLCFSVSKRHVLPQPQYKLVYAEAYFDQTPILYNRDELYQAIKRKVTLKYLQSLPTYNHALRPDVIRKSVEKCLEIFSRQYVVNLIQDIPGVSRVESSNNKRTDIHPFQVKYSTDRLELDFYTWEFTSGELYHNTIVISDSLVWSTQLMTTLIGKPEKKRL